MWIAHRGTLAIELTYVLSDSDYRYPEGEGDEVYFGINAGHPKALIYF